MRGLLGMTTMACVLAVVSAVSAQEAGYSTEPLDKIKVKLKSKTAVLADVRELREWDKGHLKDAVLLPLSKLSEWERDGISESEKVKLAKSLPKGSVVYCHCAAGGRALTGAEALRKLGYDARPLKSGYRELIEAGFMPEPKK